LVSAGPLCGAGEAALGKGFSATGFATAELAVFSGFPAETPSRVESRIPIVPITTASTK
jgi:hypothetical protein